MTSAIEEGWQGPYKNKNSGGIIGPQKILRLHSRMVLDVVISGLNTAVTFRRYNHEPQSKIAPGIILMSDDNACQTNGSVTC